MMFDIIIVSPQLHNSDHTKSVIRNILLKFDINGRPEDYVIFQALPDQGE